MNQADSARTSDLAAQAAELGPWFHNLHLPGDIQTAPEHGLGDFPARVWKDISKWIPEELSGWTALDIGCNGGFYSIELARRGANVTAIDVDSRYLRQASWAAAVCGVQHKIDFQQMQVYELARMPGTYDLVWFMGVFYHLRYPVLGLDIVAQKVKRLLVFQTMTMPGDEVLPTPLSIGLDEREQMLQTGWPVMAFVEHQLANDPTNWWAPNHACVEALLRTSGMEILQRLMPEVYLCRPTGNGFTQVKELLEAEYRAATGSV